MTKQELLNSLASKFYRVGTEALQNEVDGLRYYLVMIHDRDGDNMRNQNLAFYVENEGAGNETAYYSPSEPKPDAVVSFQQELNDYIASKITDGTIEAAYTENVDVLNETAIAKVIMPDLTERRLFIDKLAGVLRYRPL